MFDSTTRFFFLFQWVFFSFEIPVPSFSLPYSRDFTQELIDLDHWLFGSFSAAISGDLSLSILSLSFIVTATAGVMCRFIRLLVVVMVDLSWYGCMYVCIVDKWVGGFCVMSE